MNFQRREDEVEDAPEDDGDAPKPSSRAVARTFLLRIWADHDGGEPLLRGTLSDLSGKPIGAFASFHVLQTLLRRLLLRPRR